jgi:hypothetical protein
VYLWFSSEESKSPESITKRERVIYERLSVIGWKGDNSHPHPFEAIGRRFVVCQGCLWSMRCMVEIDSINSTFCVFLLIHWTSFDCLIQGGIRFTRCFVDFHRMTQSSDCSREMWWPVVDACREAIDSSDYVWGHLMNKPGLKLKDCEYVCHELSATQKEAHVGTSDPRRWRSEMATWDMISGLKTMFIVSGILIDFI